MKVQDKILRLFFSVIIAIAGYLFMMMAIKPILIVDGKGRMMDFGNYPSYITLNILSLLLGLAVGLGTYYLLTPKKDEKLETIKIALSKDEKTVVNEVEKSGEITQDSLRFRLNWSKAKLSTILTNLDKMGIIQREREGKTYKVTLQRKKQF